MQKQYLDNFLLKMGDDFLARDLKASLKIIEAKIIDDVLVLRNGDLQTEICPCALGLKKDKNGWYRRSKKAA